LNTDFPHQMPLGTRASPLALAQAHLVAQHLSRASGLPLEAFPLSILQTSGDALLSSALSSAGGKGLFTKEIDEAQLAGHVAIAVHSAKDMPSALPKGLVIGGYLEREDVRDAFIGREADRVEDLPQGAVVGSASLRRQALLKRMRPDLDVRLLRGNVQTRLAKIESDAMGGTLLALAGLKRLGLEGRATSLLPLDVFPPAPGQGAIALVVRADDEAALALAARVAHSDTGFQLAAERAFLAHLEGSCRTPLAAHAVIEGDRLRFSGMLLSPDGSDVYSVTREGPLRDAALLGFDAAHEIRIQAPHLLPSV
jgi:hydroxymethylbilane synthase